jgi:peptidoglycan-associated lipoprotein
MILHRWIALASLTLAITFVGCQRNSRQVLEDTKSAGNHAGKAFKSLGGKHGESRQVASDDEFGLQNEAANYSSKGLADGEAWGDEATSSMRSLDKDAEGGDSSSPYAQAGKGPGEAGSGLPPVENFLEPTGEMASVFSKIYFETDDYNVKGEENQRRIAVIAAYLKQHANLFVVVEGHADERASAAYNFALGSRRSNSVRNQLIDAGADSAHLFVISYGKDKPEVAGNDESAWKLNRRVQFKVYEKPLSQ